MQYTHTLPIWDAHTLMHSHYLKMQRSWSNLDVVHKYTCNMCSCLFLCCISVCACVCRLVVRPVTCRQGNEAKAQHTRLDLHLQGQHSHSREWAVVVYCVQLCAIVCVCVGDLFVCMRTCLYSVHIFVFLSVCVFVCVCVSVMCVPVCVHDSVWVCAFKKKNPANSRLLLPCIYLMLDSRCCVWGCVLGSVLLLYMCVYMFCKTT